MMSDTIAILSPGEMGHAIGRTLVNHGYRVITSLAGRSRRTAGLSTGRRHRGCRELGLTWWIRQTPSSRSCRRLTAPSRRRGSREPASPAAANTPDSSWIATRSRRRPSAEIEAHHNSDAGGIIVDVGIIGGPPTDTYQPRLYASGPQVDQFPAT